LFSYFLFLAIRFEPRATSYGSNRFSHQGNLKLPGIRAIRFGSFAFGWHVSGGFPPCGFPGNLRFNGGYGPCFIILLVLKVSVLFDKMLKVKIWLRASCFLKLLVLCFCTYIQKRDKM